ncbi:uncharacterized protein LOC116160201 [Photinus pyralis]|uniref:uncharacterized protein LOC116160201 n=1 Tax=Photinus pyralis TaxID=7054 RepID=UPI00126732EE|nr:uncharacterized protein LOC116160201 [Photinus pyralis]
MSVVSGKMVRYYKKKGTKDPKYLFENLELAIRECQAGHMTIYKASTTYNIPYSTIYSRVKNLRGAKKNCKGRLTALTSKQEDELAAGLTTLEKWGFGLSKKEVLEQVAFFVKECKLKTPFKDGIPGDDWFAGFKKRHNLSIKVPQSVEYARKKATDPFIIYNYFRILKETLEELDLENKPAQIWNLDESSFSIDPSKTKVVGKRGKPCSRVTSTPGRENTTVCFLASAAGEKAPPLIIFKGVNIWDQWQAPDNVFPGMSYAASKKGWMDAEIFLNYFKRTVIPALGPERPQLIVYDGHKTHVTTAIVNLANEQNITIIKLPPHTTHLLQPLDLSVFKSIKDAWDMKLVKWQRHNVGRRLPKDMFSKFIAETWSDAKATVIVNGFKKGGIFPFNDKVVPREKFDSEALRRWEIQNSADPLIDSNIPQDVLLNTNTAENTTAVVEKSNSTDATNTNQNEIRVAVHRDAENVGDVPKTDV